MRGLLLIQVVLAMYRIRIAQPSIERLIQASVRGLAKSDYSTDQIEGALVHAWGVDTQLIKDKTYFVVECEQIIVACGGWSVFVPLQGDVQDSNLMS